MVFDFVFLLFHRVDSIILIFPFYSMAWTQLGILYQSSSFERNSIGPAMKYPLIQMTMRETAAMLERPSIPCAAFFLVFQGGNECQIKSNSIWKFVYFSLKSLFSGCKLLSLDLMQQFCNPSSAGTLSLQKLSPLYIR